MSARERYKDMAFLRAEQISWNRNKTNTPLLPISRTAFLDGVKAGKYPKPIKLGKVVMWPTSEILDFIDSLKEQAA
jgi:Predicted transcriptional regulator